MKSEEFKFVLQFVLSSTKVYNCLFAIKCNLNFSLFTLRSSFELQVELHGKCWVDEEALVVCKIIYEVIAYLNL